MLRYEGELHAFDGSDLPVIVLDTGGRRIVDEPKVGAGLRLFSPPVLGLDSHGGLALALARLGARAAAQQPLPPALRRALALAPRRGIGQRRHGRADRGPRTRDRPRRGAQLREMPILGRYVKANRAPYAGSFEEEVGKLGQWLEDRAAWIDAHVAEL